MYDKKIFIFIVYVWFFPHSRKSKETIQDTAFIQHTHVTLTSASITDLFQDHACGSGATSVLMEMTGFGTMNSTFETKGDGFFSTWKGYSLEV